ncbi:hypothetical protein FA459_27225, partial [Pseudomonas aeruginosa]|nr:hypothetical protein [Pseudomonas aeruginosa]
MKILLLTILLALTACIALSKPEERCNLQSEYKISYIGNSSGSGSIKFNQEKNSYRYEIFIHDDFESSTQPAIVMRGKAKCTNGFVFGSANAGNALENNIKIIGGEFKGIFNEPRSDRPFGK